MTRPKPKTVRAWGFSRFYPRIGCRMVVNDTKRGADDDRRRAMRLNYAVGPVVRIEVPAPKERKR